MRISDAGRLYEAWFNGADRPLKNAKGYTAFCPAHEDGERSLSVQRSPQGVWVKCFAECSRDDIQASYGLPLGVPTLVQSDKPEPEPEDLGESKALPWGPQIQTWTYERDGTPVLTVVRRNPTETAAAKGAKRKFNQWTPDPDRPGYGWLGKHSKGLLPLLDAVDVVALSDETGKPIVVVEGEKCFDAVRTTWPTTPVTCFAGGAAAWEKTSWQPLKHRHVVLLGDDDRPGHKCMRDIAEHLHQMGCKIELVLGTLDKTDIADWINQQGSEYAKQRIQSQRVAYDPDPDHAGGREPAGWDQPDPDHSGDVLELTTRPSGLSDAAQLAETRAMWIRDRHRNLTTITDDGDADAKGTRWAWHDSDGWQVMSDGAMRRLILRIVYSDAKGTIGRQGNEVRQRLLGAIPDTDRSEWDTGRWLRFAGSALGVDLRKPSAQPRTIPRDEQVLRQVPHTAQQVTSADTQRWNQLLLDWFDNPETAESVQILFGQAIDGNDAERFVYLTGGGANGKSTFLRMIRGALGDLCGSIPGDYLTMTKTGSDHPTGLLGVENTALVISDEIPRSARWHESRIKTITGGDIMPVRGMGENFRDVVPRCLPVSHGNDLPQLFGAASLSIRRRFVVVPFDNIIATDKQIPRSEMDRLATQVSPGVLSWLIEGLAKFRTNQSKWRPAGKVLTATADYFESEDTIRTVVVAVCEEGAPGDYVTAKKLLDLGVEESLVSKRVTAHRWGRMVSTHPNLPFRKERNRWVLHGYRLRSEPPTAVEPRQGTFRRPSNPPGV